MKFGIGNMVAHRSAGRDGSRLWRDRVWGHLLALWTRHLVSLLLCGRVPVLLPAPPPPSPPKKKPFQWSALQPHGHGDLAPALYTFFIRRSPLKKSLACCACAMTSPWAHYRATIRSRVPEFHTRGDHVRWRLASRRVLPRFGLVPSRAAPVWFLLQPCRLRRYYATLLATYSTWRGAARAGSCGIFEVSASTNTIWWRHRLVYIYTIYRQVAAAAAKGRALTCSTRCGQIWWST
jgi:hypothetical protein